MVEPTEKAASRAKAVIRHQEAFKLALSMTLFYWLALYTNWPLPHYGAFAIAIISLDTTKATIEKGLMRFFGTVAGVIIGLLLLGLFNHDSWAMLVALSLYILIIGAVMEVSRYPYAWYMTAFVPLVVWGDTYPHFENAFYFGTFRWLETTAGIVIYSMVELVFWPQPEKTPAADNDTDIVNNQESDTKADSTLNRLWNSSILIKALFPPLVFIVSFMVWYLVYLPPGPKVPMLAALFSLVFLRESVAPTFKLWPVIAALILLVVAPICWLIMPRLSTGEELLTLVFIFTFITGELGGFSPPLKVLLLILFAVMAGISNQQSFSFQGPVDGALLFLLAGMIITVVYYLFEPFIPKNKT